MRARYTALLSMVCSSVALAQAVPPAGEWNPRLQTVNYQTGQIVRLQSAPGYQLMVELSPDEAVQSVALGDAASWQVSVNKAGNRLFLKPSQSDVATNMTVVTSVRIYNFELVALPEAFADMPYTVEFRYPSSSEPAQGPQFGDKSAALRRQSSYKISGDRQLRPTSVTDDGERTYISWPKDAPIPAIYAPDRFGNEVLVNGMMGADDVYVVDGTPQRLTFRIDRSVAHAQSTKKPRGRR